jgi:hypothetical protein
MEVFRRLGTMPVFDDEDDRINPAESAIRLSPAKRGVQRPNSQEQSDSEHADDDESVDMYMARLLKRVRTSEVESKAAPDAGAGKDGSSESENAARSDVMAARGHEPEEPQEPSEVLDERAPPPELFPRTVAPEKQVNLAAMRELANFSAQTAIDRHARSKIRNATNVKLLVSIMGLLTGSGTMWLACFRNGGDTAFYAATVSFAIALLWGVQYAALTGYLVIHRNGRVPQKRAAPQSAVATAKPAKENSP